LCSKLYLSLNKDEHSVTVTLSLHFLKQSVRCSTVHVWRNQVMATSSLWRSV